MISFLKLILILVITRFNYKRVFFGNSSVGGLGKSEESARHTLDLAETIEYVSINHYHLSDLNEKIFVLFCYIYA